MGNVIDTQALMGRVRGSGGPPALSDSQLAVPDMTSRGDLLLAQGLPERADLVRLGNSWGAQIKEADAFTLLITAPTTLAALALQNGEQSGGKSYIIDRVWLKAVTSLAAANYLALLAQVTPPGTAIVADSANKTVYGLSGKKNYGGKAQIAIASIVTGALADQWAPIGASQALGTSTSIAAAFEAFVYGRYVIPPGGVFNIGAQEAVSGGTAIVGVEWHEVQLALI